MRVTATIRDDDGDPGAKLEAAIEGLPHDPVIFRSLDDDMSPQSMVVFSEALQLAGEPLAWFAAPVRRYAGDRAAGYTGPNPLPVLTMEQAVRRAADERSLIGRLADAREPFWQAVADALVVVAGDRLPVDRHKNSANRREAV